MVLALRWNPRDSANIQIGDVYEDSAARGKILAVRAKKNLTIISREVYNKYGSYLLSRIFLQYHRP